MKETTTLLMSTYADYLPNRPNAPRGIPNYGNTCWLNAMCQMLLSFESFNRMICGMQKTPACGMRTAWQGFIRDGNPAKLRAEFAKLLGGGQQCADEALCMFLDALGSAVATGMLRVVMNQYTKCECGEMVKHRDPMFRIVVYPSRKSLLQNLWENMVPLNGFNCKCGKAITHRIETLGRVENAIIVTFQQYETRYIYDMPETLTLQSIDGPPHQFELVAQIEHSGGINSGHYWARVRRDGGVFRIDDDNIQPSRFESTPNTYMAAYFRV